MTTLARSDRGVLTFGSVFAGIGGLDLGLERAGMVCKWQIENDPYASAVLAKHWPDVKRYGDVHGVRELEPVDLICGGVPCQPWSVAGKRLGNDDARDLWPEFWRVCLLVRPRFVFVEEVPGFAVSGGLGRSLTDLARAGFDAEWFHLSAADVGAPHLRKRLLAVAYSNCGGLRGSRVCSEQSRRTKAVGASEVPDSDGHGLARTRVHARPGKPSQAMVDADGSSAQMADSDLSGLEVGAGERGDYAAELAPAIGGCLLGDADQSPANAHAAASGSWRAVSEPGRWLPEPDVGRVAHGVPSRVDRLRCLGNAVVPQVAEAIGRMILDAIATGTPR